MSFGIDLNFLPLGRINYYPAGGMQVIIIVKLAMNDSLTWYGK